MTSPTDTQQPDDVTTDPAEEEQQQPDDVDEPNDDVVEPEEGRAAQREQRLRRERREALAERDGLRGRLERYQRAEVEAEAAQVLAHGGDLLAVRPNLVDYLGEDGHVDPMKVRAVAEAVATERPHWRIDDGAESGRRQVRGRPKPSRADERTPSGWGAVISRSAG